MSARRLSTRQIKEVLRLRFGLGLGQDQIARSCSIAQSSVHRYLERAAAAGLTWPLPDQYDDRRLNQLLFPKHITSTHPQERCDLDLADIHKQLRSHKHVTRFRRPDASGARPPVVKHPRRRFGQAAQDRTRSKPSFQTRPDKRITFRLRISRASSPSAFRSRALRTSRGRSARSKCLRTPKRWTSFANFSRRFTSRPASPKYGRAPRVRGQPQLERLQEPVACRRLQASQERSKSTRSLSVDSDPCFA